MLLQESSSQQPLKGWARRKGEVVLHTGRLGDARGPQRNHDQNDQRVEDEGEEKKI